MMGFEVLIVLLLVQAFWDVMLCLLLSRNKYF